jgi:D-3-phosphoglycerate dehydrogenase
MSKPEVLMIGPYPDWDMQPLQGDYQIHRLWEAADRDALIDAVGPNIRAVATRGELGARAALIDRLPRLEIIACYGVGVDAIDLNHAQSHGVRVTNTPDVLTEDVADMAMALTLAVLRKVPQGDAYVRSGAWAKGNMPLATSLSGKTIGLLGLGRIGRAVARRARGFGVTIAYCDVARAPDVEDAYCEDAVALARASDVLIATVSGGEKTRNLVGAKVFDALGASGVFINVARGSVVDEPALIDALARGAIAGAGLDVFWNEPKIDPRLLEFDTVVVQPHQSSGTVETRRAMGKLVRDNLSAHFAGRALLTPVV